MKKVLVAVLMVALLVFVSCSRYEEVLTPDDDAKISLTPRPEFVDNRPEAVIQASILEASEEYLNMRKKPPHAGGGGGDDGPNVAFTTSVRVCCAPREDQELNRPPSTRVNKTSKLFIVPFFIS